MLDYPRRMLFAPPPAAPVGPTFDADVLALSGLRFFYKLDEPSGTTMADAGSGSHDGTYTNTPTLGVSGPFTGASAVTFDGTTEYGSASHHADFDFGTGDVSLGFWLRDSSWASGSSWVVAHGGDGDTGEWEVYQRGGVSGLQSRLPGGNVSSGTGLDDGAWHLIGLSIDRDGDAQFYDDGSTSGSAADISSGSATALDYTTSLRIARRASAGYSSSTISRVFGCASLLSASDWSDLYAARL